MAWNQPGDDKRRPASRSAPDVTALDDMLRRWQERMQRLWRPGSSRGKAAAVLLLLAAAVWLATGYYQIDSSERGVVQSFGRYVSTEPPGNGWHWPWPIQTLTKLNVTGIDAIDSRATLLTADQGLLAMSWSVQYRIDNPLQYLFGVRDPQATLREASETVLRELTAQQRLDALLGGRARAALTGEATDRIQALLDRYGTGLHVIGVSLTDVELPDPVSAAEHDAQRAAEDRQHLLAEAQAYASSVALKAQGSAQQMIAEAQVYATQTVAQAQGDAERFVQLVNAYRQSPEVTRDRLYIQTIGEILAHSKKIFVDGKGGSGALVSLPLDKLVQVAHGAPSPPAPSATSGTSRTNLLGDRDESDERSRARGGDR